MSTTITQTQPKSLSPPDPNAHSILKANPKAAPKPLTRADLTSKLAALGKIKHPQVTFRNCTCKPQRGKFLRLVTCQASPSPSSSPPHNTDTDNDDVGDRQGHDTRTQSKIYLVSAKIHVFSVIHVFGLSGWVAVDPSTDIIHASQVTVGSPWLPRQIGLYLGKKYGFSVPAMTGTFSGVDDSGRLLFSGQANGFHYHPSKPISSIMTSRQEGYVKSFSRGNWDSEGEGDDAGFIKFSKEGAGFKQELNYNGPFGIYDRDGVLHQTVFCSQGPVDFENLPLSLGAKLGLGLDLPI